MSLAMPGLICDGLRPMFGAAAPALTGALYQLVTGAPYAPAPEEE